MTHFQVREASSILCDGLSLRATAPDYTWNGTGQVAVTGLQAICSSSMPSNTASPHSRAPRNIWLWGVTRETSYLMPKPIKALWKYDSNCSVVFGMFAGHNSWHLIMSWYLTAQPPLSWHYRAKGKGDGGEEGRGNPMSVSEISRLESDAQEEQPSWRRSLTAGWEFTAENDLCSQNDRILEIKETYWLVRLRSPEQSWPSLWIACPAGYYGAQVSGITVCEQPLHIRLVRELRSWQSQL